VNGYSDEYWLAMAALDMYPIDDGLPKSTSVVYRIHQLGRVAFPKDSPDYLSVLTDDSQSPEIRIQAVVDTMQFLANKDQP